ncbi:MAG: nucleoside deaminase [Candidatus Omnitrophica bacterium]|nr:nucleoside deaminase [Candidatus Omnitrophota bacterium]MDD5574476.1 nucleoside deaminase [Candidatus Omnitrophota bacterium]
MPGKANDARFMRLAIGKARDGVRRGQTPFGACIVRAGRVVALSHNRVWKNTDITAHAEICAIREACRRLKTVELSGCIIYSTCEPCPMCFSACHWANISKIVYGARIADAKKLGFDELTVSNAAMKRMGGAGIRVQKDFLRNDCLELFAFWKKKGRRRVY